MTDAQLSVLKKKATEICQRDAQAAVETKSALTTENLKKLEDQPLSNQQNEVKEPEQKSIKSIENKKSNRTNLEHDHRSSHCSVSLPSQAYYKIYSNL